MDNQQQNETIKIIWEGKTIKKEHLIYIITEYIKGKSLCELGYLLLYNIATIRRFLINNNIKIRNVKESIEKFQKITTIKIDDFLNNNLIGWALGDGGFRIPKHGKNPYFTYTDKHKDHIEYIINILTTYNIKCNVCLNKNTNCFQLTSEARPEFHKYYTLFYGYEGLNENGLKRKILPNIIITPICLRNWFIGDGSSSNLGKFGNHRGFISCKYENPYITKQLKELFGDDFKIYSRKNGKIGFCYYFSNKGLIKLLKYIGKCPVDSYKYKWIVSDVQRL